MIARLRDRYLALLGVSAGPPTLERLGDLVRAHLERVPFENLSKLYYLRTRGLRDVPSLEEWLEGIERHRFGGTCYSSNPYLQALLTELGFDAWLAGADMTAPDLHVVIFVRLDGREHLVDVGYGAPFHEPMPRDLDRELVVRLGDERFVLSPPDAFGRSAVHHFRHGERVHGYLAKPVPRLHEFFRPAIAASFLPDAHFMTRARVVAFRNGESLQLTDLTLARSTADRTELTHLPDAEAALSAIEEHFGIPADVARVALAGVSGFGAPR